MVNRFMIIGLLSGMSVMTMVETCMITFVNDGDSKVSIFNELDKTFTFVTKDVKRRFGDHDKRAWFVIYMQQPKKAKKTEVWAPYYTCIQNTCSSNGNIVLKLSDIKNDKYNKNLFTIEKHEPHSSMVKKLLKKQGCQSCIKN